jgi:CHRD domain
MKRIMMAVAVLTVATTALAFTDEGNKRFREFLNGYKEAVNPISTTGTGTFHATISEDNTEINYELTFANLEDNVLQAHIHIGHTQTAGGIVLWLCGSDTNPGPAGTPRCNQNDPSDNRNGSVSGTLTVANVLPVANNGIAAGEWEEVLGLIRAGRTYANVHSVKFPGGEIRAQLDNGDDDGDGHGQGH